MSEYDPGKLLMKMTQFIKYNERVTLYFSGDNCEWYLEWFNMKGGFQCVSGPDLFTLVENLK